MFDAIVYLHFYRFATGCSHIFPSTFVCVCVIGATVYCGKYGTISFSNRFRFSPLDLFSIFFFLPFLPCFAFKLNHLCLFHLIPANRIALLLFILFWFTLFCCTIWIERSHTFKYRLFFHSNSSNFSFPFLFF